MFPLGSGFFCFNYNILEINIPQINPGGNSLPYFSEKRGPLISISPLAIPFFALALLFRFSALSLLAALLHELGHVLAILLCKGKILKITILPIGAQLDALPAKTYFKEAAVCGSGIAFNLLFAGISFPFFGASDFFVCNLLLAALNMLPIIGLDGGDLLYCLLQICLDPQRAHTLLSVISFVFLAVFWLFSVYIFLCLNGSPLLLFLDIYLFSSAFLKKK